MEQSVLLKMEGVSKSFPGVKALDGVNLEVRRGEVHGLMGENGAGKSTLIKILTGIYKRDFGKIVLDGQEIQFASSMVAQDSGISPIYQELNLIPELSVAENLFIGRQPGKRAFIDWKKIYVQSGEQLESLGIHMDVRQKIGSCSTAMQQMVAIARAVSQNAKLVIMDEPTSSLGEKEVELLFNVIRKLKEHGIATIFITHRLEESFAICDRITVLRDGKWIATKNVEEYDKYSLVSMMIGRDAHQVIDMHKTYSAQINENQVLFEARDIKAGHKVKGIDLTVRKGEVVGLAGLLGAGRTEFARAVFGADKMDSGETYIEGEKKTIRNPIEAIKAGIGLLSEDRRVEGIVPSLSVRENVTMVMLSEIVKMGLVQKKREIGMVEDYVQRIRIKTPSIEQNIANLSGGNQQKVVISRWLATKPKLLILDEPTRGIDVGAKSEIEQLIQEMSAQGIGILLISSEIGELIRNCDRVAVIQDGKKTAEMAGEEISEDAIMHALAKNEE